VRPGADVRFAVLNETGEWTGRPLAAPARVSVEDVEAEARRRLRGLKVNEWRTRAFVTGLPMPDDICQMAQQIEFAAQAIARLSPIPADFDDDVYWPRIWGA